MKYKTFTYKKHKHCSFQVANYLNNTDAMAIVIIDENGNRLYDCTVNKSDYIYEKNTATIRNYMETAGMTNFLIKLGVVEQLITKSNFSVYATSKKESIDYCDINVEILKKYSSKFDYKYNY